MKDSIRVLVTGAGSLLGQGLLRLLSIADFPKTIFTADPDVRSTGHWLGDKALKIPPVKDPNYLSSLINCIVEYEIDVLLVGTDVELPVLSENKQLLKEKYGCLVIVSDSTVVEIANDKYLTAEFLKDHDFPYPYSVKANSKEDLLRIAQDMAFPLFAKPRDGARSIGIKKINDQEELMALYDPSSNLIVQEYLSEDEGEFTSGCTVVDGKCVAIVTLKRDLRDGNTYRTYRDAHTDRYDQQIKDIAEALKADGPVNFQFRIKDDEPVIFEINGRFSGTTPLRSFYGFNEVEAILNYHCFDRPIAAPTLRNGVVMRAWSDVFVAEDQMQHFGDNNSLDAPQAEFFNFNLK